MADDLSDREHYIPEDEYEELDFDEVPDDVDDDPEDEDDGYAEGVDRDGADADQA